MTDVDRSLDSLSAAFYPIACAIIARCASRGVAVMVAQTGRTAAQHAENVAAGTSSVSVSKHQSRRERGFTLTSDAIPGDLDKADAIDLVPFAQYQLHGPDKLQWDASDPAFGVIGEEAERCGARWGGRWHDPVDPGHCELVFPADATRLAAERARPWPTYRTVGV